MKRSVPSGTQRIASNPIVVTRYCPICDWEALVILGSPGEDDCPQCHAPTMVRLPTVGTKNPHAAALGRLGGLRGGRARAKALSAKRRKDISRQAALARWGKSS